MKRHFPILLLIFLSCAACHKKPVEAPEERISLGDFIIRNTMEGAVITRDTIPPKTTVRLSFDDLTLLTPDYECRIIYVDPCAASSRSTHKGYYIFYNVHNGEWKYVQSLGFIPMGYAGQPDDYEFNHLIPEEFLEAAKYNYNKIKIPAKPFVLPAADLNASVMDDNTYVVILNTGYNASENRSTYNDQCRAVFTLAKHHYHVNPDHIYVLMADGTSADNDYYDITTGTFKNTNPDLDGDGETDIRFAATRTNLHSVFLAIRDLVSTGDNLLVYITGPAVKTADGGVYLRLWDGYQLPDTELKSYTRNIESKARVHYLIQSDYGGYFAVAGRLLNSNGTVTAVCGPSDTNTSESENYTRTWCSDQSENTHSVFSSSKSGTSAVRYYSVPEFLGLQWSPNGASFSLPAFSGPTDVRDGSIANYAVSNLQDGMSVSWTVGTGITIQSSTPGSICVNPSTTYPYLLNSFVQADISGYKILSSPVNVWKTGTVTTDDFFNHSGSRDFGTVAIKDEFQYDTFYEWTLDSGFNINLQAPFFIDYEATDGAGAEMTVSVYLNTPLGESLRVLQSISF